MKKALLVAFAAVLLVCHVFAQSSAPSEVNRIVGARLSVEYNEDKTSAIVHVVNISNKVIATVEVSYFYEGGSLGKSISGSGNVKPGESITQAMNGMVRMVAVELDAVVYADGGLETRNDAVAAEIKEEDRRAKEQHEKEMEYARAFAVPNPAVHMPQEEQIVRNYYAKLSFLSQFAVLSSVITHGSPKLTEAAARELMEDQIHFGLSEFQTGDFAEIETKPWTLLLNPDAPQGVIDVNSAGANIGVNAHQFLLTWLQAVWKAQTHAEQQPDPREQMSREVRSAGASTVKDVVRLTNPGKWTRYASFTVRTRMRGQAISYRAAFLFADQGRKIAIFDPAMHLPVQLNGPFYPALLVESVYRELPFIKKWVAENQLSGCKRLKEPEVCCDPDTGRCGLASEDVAHSLTLPIDDIDRFALKGLMEPDPVVKKQAEAPCPAGLDSGSNKK